MATIIQYQFGKNRVDDIEYEFKARYEILNHKTTLLQVYIVSSVTTVTSIHVVLYINHKRKHIIMCTVCAVWQESCIIDFIALHIVGDHFFNYIIVYKEEEVNVALLVDKMFSNVVNREIVTLLGSRLQREELIKVVDKLYADSIMLTRAQL